MNKSIRANNFFSSGFSCSVGCTCRGMEEEEECEASTNGFKAELYEELSNGGDGEGSLSSNNLKHLKTINR